MEKIDELYKAKALLNQAINAAAKSMPNNRNVQEARLHMKKAVENLDSASKDHIKKGRVGNENFSKWWGNVQAGTAAVANSPMSGEASMKSLAALNAMIAEEYKALDELEKAQTQIQPVSGTDGLIVD